MSTRPGEDGHAGEFDAFGAERNLRLRRATAADPGDEAISDHHDRIVDHLAGEDVDDHVRGGDDHRFGGGRSVRQQKSKSDDQWLYHGCFPSGGHLSGSWAAHQGIGAAGGDRHSSEPNVRFRSRLGVARSCNTMLVKSRGYGVNATWPIRL